MKSLVLYSGGLDSTTCLAHSLRQGEEVVAITFDYNQTNKREITCCEDLAELWGFEHYVVPLQLSTGASEKEVPARNTIFLSFALQYALIHKCDKIVFGAEPDSTYVDSSVGYIGAMRNVCLLHGVDLVAPIKGLQSKLEVLKRALDLGVPLHLIHPSRTNAVDGACKTSERYLTALQTLFPNVSGPEFLQYLEQGKEASGWRDLYTKVHGRSYSFKYFPALFVLCSAPLHSLRNVRTVYTTKNWGADLTALYEDLFEEKAAWQVVRVSDQDQLKMNELNTDRKEAQWGFKQALSRLPRPFLRPVLNFRVTQGHFKQAAEDLGYRWAPDNGLALKTEKPE
jgi:7-cyano-7-deazaguanine synthase